MEIYVKKKAAQVSPAIKIAIIVAIFLGFSLLFFLVFFSPAFRVKEVSFFGEAIGNTDVFKSELEREISGQGVIFSVLGPDNILFWELTGKTEESLLSRNPEAENISISRNFLTRKVSVSVPARERFGVVCGADNACFWINEKGLAFSEAPLSEGGLMNKIFLSRNIKAGELILNENLMANAVKIFSVLDKTNVRAKSLVINEEFLEARTASGITPQMLFSLKVDPTFILAAVREAFKKGWGKYSVMDFRVENRMYYK